MNVADGQPENIRLSPTMSSGERIIKTCRKSNNHYTHFVTINQICFSFFSRGLLNSALITTINNTTRSVSLAFGCNAIAFLSEVILGYTAADNSQ